MRRALGLLLAVVLAAPAAAQDKPAPKSLPEALAQAGLDPKTKAEGETLQVMLGQRAVFHLDGAKPAIESVDLGKLALAQPKGKAETYKAPPAGKLAMALDASAEKHQSILKVWNGTDKPVIYKAELVALRGGKLMRRHAVICPVLPGAANHETWNDPLLAVRVTGFAETSPDDLTCR